MTAGALAVHGYHPFTEDAEIYIPAVKKILDPALYPVGAEFFLSHARMTLFPELIAVSVKALHLSLDSALLLWHFASIALLLLGCWRVARHAFAAPAARWGAVSTVAALLTLPVAGTALYIMDPYVTARSFSTPLILLAVADVLDRNISRACVIMVIAAAIHPLMSLFGVLYLLCFRLIERGSLTGMGVGMTAMLISPFAPLSSAYLEAMEFRPYFFVSEWRWYEWLGVVGPLVLLTGFSRFGQRYGLHVVRNVSRSLILFGILFLCVSLSIPRSSRLAELQPMRGLHLTYILLFILVGGMLAQYVLKGIWWRWLALFLPLCGTMAYVQARLSPASLHLEWPYSEPRNPWLDAFLWIRTHTPPRALFAVNPDLMNLPGEDQHGFRVLSERSRLADRVKDSGAVSMFPALAERWRNEVLAQAGWRRFGLEDFGRLRKEFGVDWVVLERPGVKGLVCPYQNDLLLVCRLNDSSAGNGKRSIDPARRKLGDSIAGNR